MGPSQSLAIRQSHSSPSTRPSDCRPTEQVGSGENEDPSFFSIAWGVIVGCISIFVVFGAHRYSYPTAACVLTTQIRRASFRFDPESEAGQKVVQLVIDRITERNDQASKKRWTDGVASLTRSPTTDGDGLGGNDDNTPGSSAGPSVAQYVRDMPALALKLESRACGLLVAWVQASVLLVIELRRAEKM